MTNGKIEICKLDMMGYTKETQVFFIVNGGGVKTAKFLQENARHFVRTQHMGQIWHALPASRIDNFRGYAASKGFETVTGAPI